MGNEGNAGEGQGGQGQGAGQGSGQGAGQEEGQGSGQSGQGQGQGTGQGAGQGGQGDQGQGAGQGAGQEGNQQKEDNMSLADLETALGMPLAEAKALLAAGKKPKEEPKGETLMGADLELAKMKALMQRNVPSGQIPVLLQFLNIAGTTPTEINASLEALAQAKMLPQEGQKQQGPQGNGDAQGGGGNAQGAGNQGLQNGGQQGKTIWTAAKVRELRKTGTINAEVLADIKRAEAEGRVRE
jgi:hypothetical protein